MKIRTAHVLVLLIYVLLSGVKVSACSSTYLIGDQIRMNSEVRTPSTTEAVKEAETRLKKKQLKRYSRASSWKRNMLAIHLLLLCALFLL